MSYENGLISKTDSLSIDDVHAVLGAGSYDLGALCVYSTVNMWAKYKPVKYPGDFASSDGKHTNWWQAYNGMCGILPKYPSTLANLVTMYTNGTADWEREAPTGGESYPYRLLDFSGYYHKAVPPVRSFGIGGTQFRRTDSFTASIMYYDSTNADDKSLMLTDLVGSSGFGITDRYFAVCVEDNGKYYWKTADSTIGNGGYSLTFPCSDFADGAHVAYGFFAKGSSEGVVKVDAPTGIVTLPKAQGAAFTIVDTLIKITVIAGKLYPASAGSFTIKYTVQNVATYAIPLQSNTWQVRYQDKTYTDSITTGESTGTISNFTIAAGATVTYSVTVNFTQAMVNKGTCKIYILLNSKSYVGVGSFMQTSIDLVS